MHYIGNVFIHALGTVRNLVIFKSISLDILQTDICINKNMYHQFLILHAGASNFIMHDIDHGEPLITLRETLLQNCSRSMNIYKTLKHDTLSYHCKDNLNNVDMHMRAHDSYMHY